MEITSWAWGCSFDIGHTKPIDKPLELQGCHKDGSEKPVELALSRIKMRDGWHAIGVVRDITDRKQAEQSLRESEARFKALHNASFGGIAIHDKGVILACNQGLAELTGYSEAELVGMDGLLLIAERYRDTVKQHIATGFEKPYEVIGLRKDGEA